MFVYTNLLNYDRICYLFIHFINVEVMIYFSTDGVGHWTLAVICPLDNTIYWFDSAYSSITNTHKQYFIG